MNEKNNNGVLIILVIVLVVALCGTGGYIVYDKILAKDIEVEVVKDNDDDEENKEEKIDVNILGESLFNKTTAVDMYRTPYLYIDDLNYTNLSNPIKMDIAIQNIPKQYIIEIPTSSWPSIEECLPQFGESIVYKCASTKIHKKYFEEAYYDTFGYDKKIEYEKFESKNLEICGLENDYIVCYPFEGGGISGTKEFINYDKVEQSNDEIIVYVNYLRYEVEDGIYNTLNAGEKIDSDTYIDELYKKYAYDLNDSYKDELFNYYKGKTGKFKVTFKQDKTGNYYWDKSEFISE